MARRPKIDHVKSVCAKGKLYLYFNTGLKIDGRPKYNRLPDFSDPKFWSAYATNMGWRTRRAKPEYTVASLIADYLRSSEYARKAPSTQRLYMLQLTKAERLLARFPVNELEHGDIQMILDGESWGTATRNLFLAALGSAYTWGRRNGKARIKPVEDFARIKGGEHAPWPANVLEAALQEDDATVRLAVHLLYFTGQRIGDVLNMRWSDIDRDTISIVQIKTGKEVDVPLAAELKTELARTPKTAITIMGLSACKRDIDFIRRRLQAFAGTMGVKVVTHGLRKNAVNSLLLAGCTVAQVAAITGQSMQIVEHYAKQIDRRALGQAAILNFDRARADRGA